MVDSVDPISHEPQRALTSSFVQPFLDRLEHAGPCQEPVVGIAGAQHETSLGAAIRPAVGPELHGQIQAVSAVFLAAQTDGFDSRGAVSVKQLDERATLCGEVFEGTGDLADQAGATRKTDRLDAVRKAVGSDTEART